MNIIYMGTSEFAVPPLSRLVAEGWSVPLVVTQPDRARGRGQRIRPTAVKELALQLGINVLQPEYIRNNRRFQVEISAHKPDLIVVAAYGKILPKELLDLPKYGCVNIHGSLLPRYRGAAPIQRAILEGEMETGVTLMYMQAGLDTGDIIAAESTPVAKKTAGQLHNELAAMGADILSLYLPKIKEGIAPRIKQDESLAVYAPMISKEDGLLDFNRGSGYIERFIRAMNPWPGAYAYYNDKKVKLLSGRIAADSFSCNGIPGQIVSANGQGLGIVTGDGIIHITEIQMPGKRAMQVGEFLKGNQIEIGTILM